MSKHAPGPWRVMCHLSDDSGHIAIVAGEKDNVCDVFPFGSLPGRRDRKLEHHKANAALIAAAPDLLEALINVRKIITEGALTGFNYKDGDWAPRLFNSQHTTSSAIAKATSNDNP